MPTAWTYWISDVLLDTGCMDPPPISTPREEVGNDQSVLAKAEDQSWVAGEFVFQIKNIFNDSTYYF